MSVTIFLALMLAAMLALAWFRAALWQWTLVVAGMLLTVSLQPLLPVGFLVPAWLLAALVLTPLNVAPWRRALVSRHVLPLLRQTMPRMSDTERQALEAGDTWWDAELFSGKPDWRVLTSQPAPRLSDEEQAFLDGPVEELCDMLDDWQINHELHDLPPEVWQCIKTRGFFGMIIPKRYGGLEFSAQAHSAVVMKVASRSPTAAVTVMVPNSLGPGQLLLNYGTEEQKEHYLPRLARGEEVPCFALTSPWAGSDAASMRDTGIVCKGEFEGRKNVLGIRLNFEKRYITLAPVATVLGLAFKLLDPDHLLGNEDTPGITLALIPTNTPGVETGQRHLPLEQAFMNGPVSGKDVFIPVDWIIGGPERAGQGWRMLMECLADGRSISLPSLSAGAGKLCVRAAGGYARIRQQFHTPIGSMEGVMEPLARIAGQAWAVDAVREMTANAVDQGHKPSVMSAIAKYHCTERMRRMVNDAMDVFGGTAIVMGPRNLLARTYEAVPISITVEGANILTRSLIIFGQGVIRCHPHLRDEIEAVNMDDEVEALRRFDRALFAHLGFTLSNIVRACLLAWSGGRLAAPVISGPARRHARQVDRLSAALALISDITLAVLGGALKRRESLSARLGDILAHLYIVSAVIQRFETAGRPETDRPLLDWACEDALWRAQEALDGFLRNFPNRWVARAMRLVVMPWGRRLAPPSDRLGRELARQIQTPGKLRERLTQGIYITDRANDPLGRIERAFAAVHAAAEAEKKRRRAQKAGVVTARDGDAAIAGLREANLIDDEEERLLREAEQAVYEAIVVDAFAPSAFASRTRRRPRRTSASTG